jgi:hypothetical protein
VGRHGFVSSGRVEEEAVRCLLKTGLKGLHCSKWSEGAVCLGPGVQMSLPWMEVEAVGRYATDLPS